MTRSVSSPPSTSEPVPVPCPKPDRAPADAPDDVPDDVPSDVPGGTVRQRAPSRRALATRARILDAAEAVFAERGFDGATLRDIAARAGEPASLIHHHGGGKEGLFRQVVARRAQGLARARQEALSAARQAGPVPLAVETILHAFFQPFLSLAEQDPQWRAYARLVAYVSADTRWRDLAAAHFDETAGLFIDELAIALPGPSRKMLATRFIFCVSAMLSLLTVKWRVDALAAGSSTDTDEAASLPALVAFCTAGLCASA